jgi:hypothetical protein
MCLLSGPKALRSFQHTVKFIEGTSKLINVPSLMMSRNHRLIVETVARIPIARYTPPLTYPWNDITPESVVIKRAIEAAKGHGEASTRWYGCG